MKRHLLIFPALLFLILFLCMPSAAADAVTAGKTIYALFSDTQGDGGWYYMSSPENTDVLEYMPSYTGVNWWAGENNYQMGVHSEDHIHPGLNNDAVLVYKVPATGNVTVSFPGGVSVNDSSWADRPGDGVTFGVFYRDDTAVHTLLPMTDIGNGETYTPSAITVDVSAGGLLLFRCGNGHDHYMDYDNTYMAPSITYNSVEDGAEITKSLLPPAPGEKYPVTVGCTAPFSDRASVITDNTYEIGTDKNGQVLSLSDIRTEGTEIVISASDIAVTDLFVNGGSVTVTGDRVTFENCSVQAPIQITGVGFFAQHCAFSDISVTGTDAVIARSQISGTVTLSGKNQTLYGSSIAADLRITGASDVSVIANTFADGTAGTVSASRYINLSDNTYGNTLPADFWKFDDRDTLWGSDLPGVLDGTDHAGADVSRLPRNNNARFASSTKRTQIYFEGSFVTPAVYLTAAAAYYSEVIYPAGIYENLSPISLLAQKDVTIAAYGMYAKFESYTRSAVNITQSDHIRILGMTVDHMMNANAQGTVISNAGGKLVWKSDDGYNGAITDETLFAKNGASLGFQAGERLPYVDQAMPDRIKNDDGTYTLNVISELKAGDRLTFRGLAAHVCTINESGKVTFADVTVWGGSGFAFSGWMGEDRVTLSRCSVVPGPAPDGASEPRMISTCDASHFSNMRVGPVLEDCVFTDMTDDGTNINGHYMMTSSYDASSNTYTIRPEFEVVTGVYASHTAGVDVGDRIRILTKDYAWIGDTTAASAADDGTICLTDRFDGMTDHVILQNLDRQSNGFSIKNCVVERIRSRGLLIKGTDGVIEHCTIRDVRMSGILVKPESNEWPEFGFAQNLVIRNNHIIGTGYAAPTNNLYASINVSGDTGHSGDPLYHLHKSIVIEGNLIENRRNACAIKVSHTRDAVIRSNTITARDSSVHGDPANDVQIPITILSATNVEVTDNTVPASAHGTAEVKTGTNNVWGTDLNTENAPVKVTDPIPIREESAETEVITDLTESGALEVIGGTDGPTAIMTTGPLSWLWIAVAVLVIAVGITVVVLVMKKKRK